MQLLINSVAFLSLTIAAKQKVKNKDLNIFSKILRTFWGLSQKGKKKEKEEKNPTKPTENKKKKAGPFRKHDWNAFNLGFPSGTVCNCFLKQTTEEGTLSSQEAWQMISKVRHMHKRNNSFSLCALLQHLSLCYLWHCLSLVPLRSYEGCHIEWVQCCPKHETEAATCQYTANSSENPSIDFLGVTPPQLFSQPNAASPECVIVIDQNRVSGLINVLSLLVRALVFKECPSCYLWLLIKAQSYLNNQCAVK